MPRYLVFSVMALPVFVGHVATTSVMVAFPALVEHYGTSLVLAGWVLGIYPLASVAALPVMSWLSDARGRRFAFRVCLFFFTLGSLFCALAPNMPLLILARVIQAVGGGGFVSAATGLVSDGIPEERQKYIGLLSSVSHFGSVLGPALGGVMVQYLGWQSIFWLNVPIGATSLALSRYFLKSDVRRAVRTQLDLPGIGMLAGFATSIMVALTLLGKDYNLSRPIIVGIIISGLLMLVGFVWRAKRSPKAFVNDEMLTSKPFLAANAFNFFYGSSTQTGIVTFIPLYAIGLYGMSVFESGLMIAPRSFAIIIASVITSFYLVKWGYRKPMLIGTLTVMLGMVLLSFEPQGFSLLGVRVTPLVELLLLGMLLGVGAGMTNPACNNACLELMPDRAASITGLRQISRQMGGAIGIAVCTLVLESSSSMARGFTLLFLGFSAVQILSIALVFWMPDKATADRPATAHGHGG